MTTPEHTSHDVHHTSGAIHEDAGDAPAKLLGQLGGTRGMTFTAIPFVVFVVANALLTLPIAIGIAVAIGLVLTVVRVLSGEPFVQACGGLVGVVAAGGVAAWTGSAEGFFLIGIWANLAGAAVTVGSVLVRRPLTGFLWNVLHGNKYRWRDYQSAVREHDIATLTFAAVFGARYIVQDHLHDAEATGWLAFAKIAMGTPLIALAVLITVWAFRRTTKNLANTKTEQG
ncbi:MAG: DUF3159 domain-containing protein [Rhodococcus sp. (in: high G+C Gram-positive bacteria)]